MDVLEHLTLATSTGTFVHNRNVVVVRSDDLGCGTVGRDPALLFAAGNQHAIDALFGRWAWVIHPTA